MSIRKVIDADFGTTGLGIEQHNELLLPYCGDCLACPTLPDVFGVDFVCIECGKQYEINGTCDTAIHVSTERNWLFNTVAAWLGVPADSLTVVFE